MSALMLSRALARCSVRWALGDVRHKSRSCFKGRPARGKYTPKISPRKAMIANEVRRIFSSSALVAVYHYNDLSVAEWDGLRSKLEEKNLRMKVIPCKVSTKALESTKYTYISLLLRGTSALAYSSEPCLSDLLAVTSSEQKIHLLGGVVEDCLMTPDGMKGHAKLPDKMAVYQQLLGTLMLPQTLLSNTLLTNQMRLSQMLGQLQRGDETGRRE